MKKTTHYRTSMVLMIIGITLLVTGAIFEVLQHDYITAFYNVLWIFIAFNYLILLRKNRELEADVSWMTPIINTLIEAIKEEQKEENNQ